MTTDMLQYLDPDGLGETVVNISRIKTDLEGQMSDLEEDMQNLPYARPDGLYPDMTVGSVIGVDETAQWATRESTGSGAATVRSVQGAAVVWNQMTKNGDFANGTHWEKISTYFNWTATDNTAVLTATDGNRGIGLASDVVALVDGHKYLASCYAKTSNANALFVSLNSGSNTINAVATSVELSSAFQKVGGIVTYSPPSSGTNRVRFATSSGTTASGDVLTLANVQLFDLTLMFGAGNEPATVAEFERMFPASYYPYSAPTLKPVQIAGFSSTDAQGGELDAIEWPTQTLRAAGSVADMLYSDHVDVRVGVVDLGTVAWITGTDSTGQYFRVAEAIPDAKSSAGTAVVGNISCAKYTPTSMNNVFDGGIAMAANGGIPYVRDTTYTTAADFKAAMDGVLLFYELATPTTMPISPALPMTYRVQAGGTESIIVPSGEVSAVPVLTVAEPVNAGDEFARIWEAIRSLGYTRDAAQLSHPVSLTDVVSIDDAQKDTTEVVEIDTTKEVQE